MKPQMPCPLSISGGTGVRLSHAVFRPFSAAPGTTTGIIMIVVLSGQSHMSGYAGLKLAAPAHQAPSLVVA